MTYPKSIIHFLAATALTCAASAQKYSFSKSIEHKAVSQSFQKGEHTFSQQFGANQFKPADFSNAAIPDPEPDPIIDIDFLVFDLSFVLKLQGVFAAAPSLPINQPFNVSPWNFQGNEVMPSANDFPADAQPIDWVLVSVVGTHPSGTIYSSDAAGILTTSGKVYFPKIYVPTSGQTPAPVQPNLVVLGNSFDTIEVVISHRNHLDVYASVTTADTIQNGQQFHFDFIGENVFTTSNTDVQPNSLASVNFPANQQVTFAGGTIDGGLKALRAGDFNNDGVIQNTDLDLIAYSLNSSTGYWLDDVPGLSADPNMDGVVDTDDFNLWNSNGTRIGHPMVRALLAQ